jgi:ABC-type multidrug transport system ATPase subunit
VSVDDRSDESVLEAVSLAKTFRRGPERVLALSDASLQIEAGEIVALVGPSGSGKTTLLSILAGWEQADDGEVRWMGVPLDDAARLTWSELAIIPQTLGLVEELTVWENVALPGRLGPGAVPGDGDMERLLSDLGLEELPAGCPASSRSGSSRGRRWGGRSRFGRGY